MTIANSLDSDQTPQNIGPDLGTLIVFLKDFFFFLKKFILKKVMRQQQKHEKLTSMQRVKRLKPPYHNLSLYRTLQTLDSPQTFTFANSLDSDQDKKNICPDLDPNCLTHGIPKEFFRKADFGKNQQTTKYCLHILSHVSIAS